MNGVLPVLRISSKFFLFSIGTVPVSMVEFNVLFKVSYACIWIPPLNYHQQHLVLHRLELATIGSQT